MTTLAAIDGVSTGRLAYGLTMALSLAVFIVARKLTRQVPALTARQQTLLGCAAFVGGVFGAKAPFVLQAESGPFTLAAWTSDGKTLTTGLIGAYLCVELTKRLLGVRAKTGDALALPLALALTVGRWGCFLNGCCVGQPTDLPWAVDFGDGLRRHPAQVYESLFHASMATVLWTLPWDRPWRHQRLKLYLICYGVFRFVTEFIRPAPAYALGLTFYQWAALALIAGLACQWAYDARQDSSTSPNPLLDAASPAR